MEINGDMVEINDTAIYLRKSRGDVDADLDKHRMLLLETCERIGCRYQEYPEIGTSDSVQDRPMMLEMLKDIEQGLFDAVAVVDIDRLGRGDDQDWGKIQSVIKDKEIYIITPEKTYDWSNENDEFQIETKKFFARLEYRQITKRLRRGKILGAKKGCWTNGKPPYPYYYDKDSKQILVDEDKERIYRQIIEMAVTGMPANAIAWELNKLGCKSPGGKSWSNNAVYRILKDQTHLNKIVFAKQKGSGHKNHKTKPLTVYNEDDWIVVDGHHKALKTQDEHNRIIELLYKHNVIPKASRHGAYLLSGLVFCQKCNHRMGFTFNGESNVEYIKKCQHRSDIGERCDNSGVNCEIIIKGIFDKLEEREYEIISNMSDDYEFETKLLKAALLEKQNDLSKEEKALERVIEMREVGEIDRDTFIRRKQIREGNIEKISKDIHDKQMRIQKRLESTPAKKLKSIQEFRRLWGSSESAQKRNQLLKTIIDRINYCKDGDNAYVDINFR